MCVDFIEQQVSHVKTLPTKIRRKTFPLYNTLKRVLENKDFKCTDEAKTSLKKHKITLAELLTLGSPVSGEMLTIYLSTSKLAVSTILVANRDEKKVPMYFMSRVLQGADIGYSNMENLALSLSNTTRLSRRYFLAHPIEVLTNKPIRKVLLKTKKLGHLAKWAVE